MRDAVIGVLIGAAAVVVASWYLTRTRGQLLPFQALGLATPGAQGAPGAPGCSCGRRGYQASGATRGPAQAPQGAV